MEDTVADSWEKVISPRMPELKDQTLEQFRGEFYKYKIEEIIGKSNLELSMGNSEAFFNCLPDAEEISRNQKLDTEKVQLLLDATSYAGKIAEIRLENTDQKVPRKVTGYLVVEKKNIDLLIEKTSSLLEFEFNNRMKSSVSFNIMLKEIQSKMRTLEGSFLGRIFHMYEALILLKELLQNIDSKGSDTYFEVLEKKMWKILESQEVSKATEANPEHEAVRRAEDTEKWKSYARDKTFKDPIVWQQTCKSLGAFFTFRILMRREKFSDILELLEFKDVCNNREDFEKILKDCNVVMERFTANPQQKDKIPHLQRIIGRIETALKTM